MNNIKYGLVSLKHGNKKMSDDEQIIKRIGIVSPYLSKLDGRFRTYIDITKQDSLTDRNSYPIHLTEMTLQEFSSTRDAFNRYEYNVENSALGWIPVLDELVLYDDYGTDLFMKKAIEIAKKYNIPFKMKRYFIS